MGAPTRLTLHQPGNRLARADVVAPFGRVGIVGLGLIGGSIALAVREAWPDVLVVGVDRNDAVERAVTRGAIDVGADDLGMLAEVGLVILAAPVRENVEILGRLADAVAGDAVVTDVGSTKRTTAEAAERLPARLPFVGGHPLAGAAHGGLDGASSTLFVGCRWVLTPGQAAPADAVSRVVSFVGALGATHVLMTPADHDATVAVVSHLPQVAASALMRVAGETVGDDGLSLAGAGLADTTRLASSPGEIWADICATNADHLGPALDRLIEELAHLRSALHDRDAVVEAFAAAAAWRARLRARDV